MKETSPVNVHGVQKKGVYTFLYVTSTNVQYNFTIFGVNHADTSVY